MLGISSGAYWWKQDEPKDLHKQIIFDTFFWKQYGFN